MKKVYKPEEWGISKHDQKIIELIFQLEQEQKKFRLTQNEIAKRANIVQGQLSRIENLESMPSLESINNIAEAMDKKLVLI